MNKTLVSIFASVALAAAAIADNGTRTCEDDCTASDVALGAVDVVLVRPVTFVGTAIGFVGFAVTSPFTAMADVAEDSWNTLVEKPAKYTLDRDLGDFGK
jgi:hypothetical protein